MKKRFAFRALIQYSRLTRLTIILSCLILLGNVNLAISELTHDPAIDPIPIMDFDDLSKVIVVDFNFIDATTVEILSTEVVYGFPPARAGHPPLLEVTLHELDGFLVEQFNAWNPLWKFVWDGSGNERLEIQSEGRGTIIFPFRPEVATARLINLTEIQEIVSVDLIPMLHNFYNEHPDDPDFTNVVNRLPTCNANGPYSMECAGSHTMVTLDGTNSSDLDGDTLDYNWSGPFAGSTATGPTPTVQFSGLGQFSIDLEVNDNFGGIETCGSEVAVIDTTPPVISCSADTTIECNESSEPSNTGSATAMDTCGSSLSINYSDSMAPGNCPQEKTITRGWIATDSVGNSSYCPQEITVVDTTAPVISFNAPPTIIPPDAPISFTSTATDNCDTDQSVVITSYDCYKLTKKGKRVDKTESCVVSIANDTITIMDSGGVDTHIAWSSRATDSCDNFSEQSFEIHVVNPGKN